MISFELAEADQHQVFSFFEALRLCTPATTLGDVYTLVLYPAHSSHRALSPEERERIGIGDGLVRLSVGIEAMEDIIADLEQALDILAFA
jgi:cystathionine gamma-synthase/methionine-gamma-lyase